MNIHADLDFVTDALPELEPYLLSQEVFWPLGANHPRLTLGGLRLILRRLQSLAASPREQATLDRLATQVNVVHTRWRTAWEQKATRELRTRLTLWQNFLGDYRLNPENYADSYPHEVRLRVIITLLIQDLSAVPPETDALLASQDSLLRVSLQAGGFVWEPTLQPSFPPDPFWYLYGTLKVK